MMITEQLLEMQCWCETSIGGYIMLDSHAPMRSHYLSEIHQATGEFKETYGVDYPGVVYE